GGASNDVVTGLIGDIAASTLTGTLTVTTADNTSDNTISITTGSNTTSVTDTFGTDTVTVHAAQLANDTQLTLVGAASYVVDGLEIGSASCRVSGKLTVTTADNNSNNNSS